MIDNEVPQPQFHQLLGPDGEPIPIAADPSKLWTIHDLMAWSGHGETTVRKWIAEPDAPAPLSGLPGNHVWIPAQWWAWAATRTQLGSQERETLEETNNQSVGRARGKKTHN